MATKTALVDIIARQQDEAERTKAEALRRDERKREESQKDGAKKFCKLVSEVWPELLQKVEYKFSSSLGPCLVFHQDFTRLLDKNHSDEQFELTYHEYNNHDSEGPDWLTQYWELRGRYGFSKKMYRTDWEFSQSPFKTLINSLAEFPKVARDYQERFGR